MTRWHLKCLQEGNLDEYTSVVNSWSCRWQVMTFPITIVDNFFEDPDAIVEQALLLQVLQSRHRHVGQVNDTKQLHAIDNRFFNYFGEKLFHLHFNPGYQRGGLCKHTSKDSTIW